MAKYFLGSVGKAEALRRGENGLEVAFVSKTLTDSGLNISTTKDDIRAGQGAPIQFSFYHDPNVEITLTDVLWNKNYLTAQLGAQFKDGADGECFDIVKKAGTLESTKYYIDLSTEDPKQLPFNCSDVSKNIVWAKKVSEDDSAWRVYEFNTDKKIEVADTSEYCVRYLRSNANANVAKIYSLIVPEELFLIITAPIFAGDACAASKGTAAGSITFEVPRFQLNGAQEFSMNMSQNQNMSLAGIALASEDTENCDDQNGGLLLKVIEVINNNHWYDDVTELIVDEDCLHVGANPVVYALRKNGSIVKAPNKDLCYRATTSDPYTAMTDAYIFTAAGALRININKGTSAAPVAFLSADEEVTVAA